MRPLSWDAWIDRQLNRLEDEGLARQLIPGARAGPRTIERAGRELVNFSSNDYLGLSQHPALLAAAERDLRRGAGSTASRLMCGNDYEYQALEAALAFFKGTEAALVFGSGYLANVGVIPALVGRHDHVFGDRLNHASIVDGVRISGATLHRYRHNDATDLDRLMAQAPEDGRKLIVTESLFGMDGDLAPLRAIAEIKLRHGAALMVDEAHATGVLGAGGRGWAHAQGVASEVDVHLGTLGKAFGLYGGFVAGRRRWIDFLVSAARSFVFTTALPPALVGAAGASLEMVIAADSERRRVLELSALFREGLRREGLAAELPSSQILPVVVGSADAAVRAAAQLEEAGVLAVAVRPPTVPRGSARLRFSVCAHHTEQDVARAVSALVDAAGVAHAG